ncbi:MAG: cell division protein FtsL [Eubacteriaceae bacterium]|nr:cell division protein FtsL [Eubacteriaceae bacterium]
MKTNEKKRIILGTVLIGFICILIVVLSAYSAELKYENNKLVAANETLQGEIDTISVKIKSANNVENIEKIATSKLGMVYPSEDECIYVSDADVPKENFAILIKEKAYN